MLWRSLLQESSALRLLLLCSRARPHCSPWQLMVLKPEWASSNSRPFCFCCSITAAATLLRAATDRQSNFSKEQISSHYSSIKNSHVAPSEQCPNSPPESIQPFSIVSNQSLKLFFKGKHYIHTQILSVHNLLLLYKLFLKQKCPVYYPPTI